MTNFKLPSEAPVIEWQAPQHATYERGRLWYIGATAFIAALFIYSIITRAWTFTILIVALGAWYWNGHKAAPPNKRMRVWQRGFAIEDTYYDWKECTGYWIFKQKNYAELHIEKNNGGEVKIQTGEFTAYQIHEALAPFLPEFTDRKEHILDTIIRICKL